MELKDFISKTLIDFSEGVIDAQNALADKGVMINPTMGENGYVAIHNGSSRAVQNVRFNVEVAVEENTSVSGSVKIVVASIFGAGSSLANDNKQKGVSTITFEVPISLPFQGQVTDGLVSS